MNKSQPEILIITNSVYPYHLHNVSILSLPFGATYHFRYEHGYFQLDSAGIANLKGKTGILVLRDFERATFVPLRTFRVIGVDDSGEFVFLDLQFLNFVEYSASRSEIDPATVQQAETLLKEREKYTQVIASQLSTLKIDNTKNQHLAKLIISAKSNDLANVSISKAQEGGSFTNAWVHLVTILGGMTAYKGICFYLVSTLLTLNSAKSASRFSTGGRAGVVFRTGEVYLIRVYQVIGDRTVPAKPGYKIQLRCIEGHLSPLRSEIFVDGAYDRLSFYAAVLPLERETNQSEMLFSCSQSVVDPGDSSKISSIPVTSIQLEVRWPRRAKFVKWVIKPASFLIGAGLFVMADKIKEALSLGDSGKYLIQLVGLALLAFGGTTWAFLTGSIKSGPPGSRT